MKTREGYQVIDFRNKPIRILREGGANGTWICLYDLCKVLKRPMMMETREAQNLCSSTSKIIFKKNDKPLYAIRPRDVSKLVFLLKNESKSMEKLCEELETWAGSFSDNGIDLFIIDQKKPVVFTFMDKFPVTFKIGNGKIFVNATEMAKAFGKSPAVWIRFKSTSELRHSLIIGEKSNSFEGQVITLRGINGATWMEESLVQRFAEWLSSDFAQWCSSKILELKVEQCSSVDQKKEITDKDTHSALVSGYSIPQTMDEALRLTVTLFEEIKELKEEAAKNKPKVEFYENFIENRDYFKSSMIAEELQISTRMLHGFLLQEKICIRKNQQLVVHENHAALQCVVPYYWKNKRGKTNTYNKEVRWTPAGREYILELWRAKHSDTQVKE
ncbi:phage antirepressor KilAC domain-containing protein [Bacteroides salyersiae]|uniref:KilA-N domain-containing protein n=3 Tax=Bacteroides salyersiae TaxID=291644 RepID=A0A7J4XIC3_9BACE|nr:phage antirepressor KilAC domain-containing protein [Bacteroides salyersiae]KAA3688379.1 hypothetical protein F3F90_23585 [Bacteroides salyersiae]KAA3696014.1 hypothetical protein F3F89_13990 [Bacteroides salyersiae]KAA3703251.1 hypothetical protein F3G09_20815 [Bacteroides salyersiae]KAA3710831.1 hypothetical protein F3G06_18110 [Bacteroides salyersiae]KAA3719708.1 hypothetical protein F3F67_20910 [Bacteroides salyersiae]